MKAKNFKPIGNNILVKTDKKEETKTVSGIILEGEALSDNTLTGEVARLGTGVQTYNGGWTQFNVKEGDRVRFKDFTGFKLNFEDEEDYVLLIESDILGVNEQD